MTLFNKYFKFFPSDAFERIQVKWSPGQVVTKSRCHQIKLFGLKYGSSRHQAWSCCNLHKVVVDYSVVVNNNTQIDNIKFEGSKMLVGTDRFNCGG